MIRDFLTIQEAIVIHDAPIWEFGGAPGLRYE